MIRKLKRLYYRILGVQGFCYKDGTIRDRYFTYLRGAPKGYYKQFE